MTSRPPRIEKEDCYTLTDIVRRLFEHQAPEGEQGQGLAEYALILALIAIVAILSLIFLGDTINELMSYIGSTVSQNT
jgi:Flp pilus assembly pilin Flp